MTRTVWGSVGVLAAIALLHVVLPASRLQDACYLLVGAGSIVLALHGLMRHRLTSSVPWRWLLAGMTVWFLGDLTYFTLPDTLRAADLRPSDIAYLMAYPVFGIAAIAMMRNYPDRKHLSAVLDAMILTAGVAVPLFVFMVLPAATDPDLGTLAKLRAVAYPVGEVVLLGLLGQLFVSPRARTVSTRLLVLALVAVLFADVAPRIIALITGQMPHATDVGWLAAYILAACAANVPSVREVVVASPRRSLALPGVTQLVMLGIGSAMPGLTLLAQGIMGQPIAWVSVSVGAILLSTLVVLRMAGLLAIVRRQADAMTELARLDPLTGLLNRRVWDETLDTACEQGGLFTVALVDLDHFKAYNDSHGHQAGDRLLQEAATAWTTVLPPSATLARYGGEEFAIHLPDHTGTEALAVLNRMNEVTPRGQTFSAGACDSTGAQAALPRTITPDGVRAAALDPDRLLHRADAALYLAKSSGRNRVVLSAHDTNRTITREPH